MNRWRNVFICLLVLIIIIVLKNSGLEFLDYTWVQILLIVAALVDAGLVLWALYKALFPSRR